MIEVVRSREIHVPPAGVWDVLADFGSIGSRAPNVDHSCLMSDQPSGVGAIRRVQVGRTALVERVTSWDDPTGLEYALEGLPPIVRSATNEWRIEPVGSCSLVSLTSRVDAGPRPPHQLIAMAVGRRLATASVDMLTGLSDHLHTERNAS